MSKGKKSTLVAQEVLIEEVTPVIEETPTIAEAIADAVPEEKRFINSIKPEFKKLSGNEFSNWTSTAITVFGESAGVIKTDDSKFFAPCYLHRKGMEEIQFTSPKQEEGQKTDPNNRAKAQALRFINTIFATVAKIPEDERTPDTIREVINTFFQPKEVVASEEEYI